MNARFFLLWIILLGPPGNISSNKILPNTLRIIMLPVTLQKVSAVVVTGFKLGAKGLLLPRIKGSSYLYHPGWKTDLGEFVLFHVMVMLRSFTRAWLLSVPIRITFQVKEFQIHPDF